MQSRKYNTGQNFVIGTLKIAKIICKLPLQKGLIFYLTPPKPGNCNGCSESTITQKMAAVHFPSNGPKSLRKRMNVFWKIGVRQEIDLFILPKWLII